jgi:hypothetical protein
VKLLVRKTNNTIDFNVIGNALKKDVFPGKKTIITNVNDRCFAVHPEYLPSKKHGGLQALKIALAGTKPLTRYS